MTRPVFASRLAALGLLLAVPPSGFAQVVTAMTPERIEEALAWGRAQEKVSPYPLRAFPAGFIGQKREGTVEESLLKIGFYTTPFLRVAMAASQARQRGKTLAARKVGKELLAPEIHVLAFPQTKPGGGEPARVESILVNGMMKRGTGDAIQPSRTPKLGALGKDLRALYAAAAPEGASIAVFPLSLLAPENVVHTIFDARICMHVLEDPERSTEDCVWPFGRADEEKGWGVEIDGGFRPIR